MSIQEVSNLVGTLGFPIACCIALFWQQSKSEDRWIEELNKLKEVVDNNNKLIEKLLERMANGKE